MMPATANLYKTVNKVATSQRPLFLRSISTRTEDDYQFLEQSKLRTMHFQKSLPRLPIPAIEKTCERYLNAQKPILSDEQFAKTSAIVNKFQTNDGKDLNDELIAQDKKNKHTSYITGPWFDMYLTSRVSTVLNYNPFMGFSADPNPRYNNQLVRATNMLVSSLRFYKSLKDNILSPQVFHIDPIKSDNDRFRNFTRFLPSAISCYGSYLFKAFPLDMSQFKNLFNSTRVPCHGRDKLEVSPNDKHMLVIRNGHYYIFDAIDENGDIYSPEHILACLKHIMADSRPPSENSIGVMTSENRDTWASVRDHLISIGNEKQFKLIDSAIFALVLEDEDLTKDEISFTHQMLHGNANNRWFDKSFSLILEKGGSANINFEHAWGDGVAILRYFEEIYKDSTGNHFVHPHTAPANVDTELLVKTVEFKLDDKTRTDIAKAHENYKDLISPLRITAFRYEGLSKEFIKSKKLSPDSVVQLAFQMAFYKMYGYFPATYESCSTSAFKHGRTETMRPCTVATKEFTEAVCRSDRPSNKKLMGILTVCSKTHAQLVREAAMGKGFDRHLFALRVLAEKKSDTLPDMFKDPAYTNLNRYILSTSTLSSDALGGAAFAPVVTDGFGLGYGFWHHITGTGITYYEGQRDGEGFKSALKSSFDDLCDILSSKSSD